MAYDRLLQAALNRKALTLLVGFGLFFAAVWAVGRLGNELIPQLTEGEFFFEATMPEGT